MMKTKLILVRHGETEWNVQRKWQGHLDSPLSATGRQQTLALGSRFRNIACTHLYSSDLGRAYQTAQPISEATGLPINTDPALRERSLGIFEGSTSEAMQARYPEEHKRFLEAEADYAVPGAESLQQFYERSITAFQDLAGRHLGQTIVVVTHGGCLVNLFRFLFNLPIEVPRRFAVINTSLSTVTCEEGFWQLETWGDVAHLETL
jgi:probable phosphoglycerate mutase